MGLLGDKVKAIPTLGKKLVGGVAKFGKKHGASAIRTGAALAGAAMVASEVHETLTEKKPGVVADIEEAKHTADELAKHAKAAQTAGVKGKVKAAQAAKTEVREAKQYRDTRKQATIQDPKFKNIKPVQMDPRPQHLREKKAAGQAQAANVAKTKSGLLKKCKDRTKAIRKFKEKNKALKACDAKYQ